MNTQSMPSKQQGAALVMAMVFLASGLMVGVSGLGASLVNERLAGNYRALTLAQMAAEDMAAWVVENNFPEADQWSPPDNKLENTQVGNQFVVERRYGRCLEEGMCSNPNYFIIRGRVLESGSDALVIAEHFLEVGQIGGNIESPEDYPSTLDSTLLCVGDTCPESASGDFLSYFMTSGNLPNDFACSGNGCRPGSGNRHNEEPQENNEFFQSSYRQSNSVDEWETFINRLSGEEVSSGNLGQGSPNNPQIIEVVEGNEVMSSGNTNTSGIIIVRRGGEFRATGTGSHEGIIIVEGSRGVRGESGYQPAGQLTLGNNFSLYGSLVTFNSLDNITVGSSTSNGGARYNASALTGLPAGGGLAWSSL